MFSSVGQHTSHRIVFVSPRLWPKNILTLVCRTKPVRSHYKSLLLFCSWKIYLYCVGTGYGPCTHGIYIVVLLFYCVQRACESRLVPICVSLSTSSNSGSSGNLVDLDSFFSSIFLFSIPFSCCLLFRLCACFGLWSGCDSVNILDRRRRGCVYFSN